VSDASFTEREILLSVQKLTQNIVVEKGGPLGSKKRITPVKEVSFDVYRGETFGIVGESGSGKTTLLRSLALISRPSAGHIRLGDEIIFDGNDGAKNLAGKIQMVFQDPASSLNPTMKVKNAVAEPLIPLGLSKSEIDERVVDSLRSVGMADFLEKYPNQMSGGQKQRVSIARAIAPRPKLVLLDEPTSALDAAVQAQVLNILMDLQKSYNLTYVFVTHNIAIAKFLADRIAVFYDGRIRELGSSEEVFSRPLHPYTASLIEAFPLPDPDQKNLLRVDIQGEPPSLFEPVPGCSFHPRCQYGQESCRAQVPELRTLLFQHMVACHRAELMDQQRAPKA
jgi:oligopeptide/dipeptide ABC transporter ATP-binding protein